MHRCLQGRGISRLPGVEGDKPKRQRFKRYHVGFFHIDIVEVQTAEGKLYLFVGLGRTSKFPEKPRNRNAAWSRQIRFDMICDANDIEHRPQNRTTRGPTAKFGR